MDDNQNKNQPKFSAADYQKILDQYAASVKPEDTNPEVEVKKPEIDLNITTSLKEAPVVPQENKIPELTPDITEAVPPQPTETFLKSVNSPQLESPIHPSLAANLEAEEDQFENPPKSTISIEQTPEPTEKSPEEIKAEINRLLSDDNSQTPSPTPSTMPSSSHGFPKIFFIFSLILFLGIIAALGYFLFLSPSSKSASNNSTSSSTTPTVTNTQEDNSDQSASDGNCQLNGNTYSIGESFKSADGCNTCSCSSAGVIACTEMACNITPTTTTATKSATVTSTTKTAFQKMITNFSLYKNITKEERELSFSSTTSASVFWPSWVKNTDKLYPFAQKLIKGSIKILTIDHRNLDSILTDEAFQNGYDYTFYLTPNYENWTNKEFKNLKYEGGGIGELTPAYAYSDKLIWTTRNNCGGARSESIEGQKVQDQCNLLVKEIETAFP